MLLWAWRALSLESDSIEQELSSHGVMSISSQGTKSRHTSQSHAVG